MSRVFLLLTFLVGLVIVNSKPSFVVTTEEPLEESAAKEGDGDGKPIPKIYEMLVTSNVSNRFSKTLVTSRVKNSAKSSQETSFSVILPTSAYISGFVLEIGGKSYEAYVKEKEDAKKIYDEAKQQGLSAGHVAVSARDSNRFDVSVNLEPESKASFLLTYEELLKRENNQYEIVINIHPGQPVRNMVVDVNINESRPLKFVRAPSIRSGNEISKFSKEDLDPRAEITHLGNTSADVKFAPDEERQKQIASGLGTKENEGLAGQFVVQYDVERDPSGGEVLLQDGYFVHFFAPTDVEPLPKQVVFVLDTSGSMYNRKIEQLKEAMESILGELKESDTFNIVEFNSIVRVHDLKGDSVSYPKIDYEHYQPPKEDDVKNYDFPVASDVTPDNVKKATEVVKKFVSMGGTNIYDALVVGLRLVELARANEEDAKRRQPMIVFLTDGEPNGRVSDTEEITSKISEMNVGVKQTPIFSLSFGYGADKSFLQKLSLRNQGFSRHIYEAADATIQLEDFYKQISSPLLTNVVFKYSPSVSKVTKMTFPIFFRGSELIIAGIVENEFPEAPEVYAQGLRGRIILKPTISRPVSHLERLWAYLTVQQLLEAKETAKNDTSFEKKALDLALKYSFVTPVTSLVVVKPNDTNGIVEPTAADKSPYEVFRGMGQRAFRGKTRSRMSVGGIRLSSGYAGSVPALYSPMAAAVPSFQVPLSLDSVGNVNSFQTTPIAENSEIEVIKTEMAWLTDLISKNDDTVTTSKGTFKLGTNETIPDGPVCPKTPTDVQGKCALLHECPTMLKLLTDENVFHQFKCEMQGFVGVCCPEKDYIMSAP